MKKRELINASHGTQVRHMVEQLQQRLREKLLEELWDDRESLEDAIAQPDTYSYKFHTYKERYLDKLADLQRIWNELVNLEKSRARKL